ncbi:MAG: hypothetical protein ACYTDY_05790 [Planctomycetota bacterium]|jgi:hypothetical protein
MLDLYDELKALVLGMEERGVEYALCGGLAMAVYHVPRATIDIDLLVQPNALEHAGSVAHGLGYAIEAKPLSLASGKIEIRRLSKVDPDSHDLLSLDLVLVTPVLEEVWDSRVRVEWDEGSLSVVSREGLIRMKSLRNSGQDMDDIRALEEHHAG